MTKKIYTGALALLILITFLTACDDEDQDKVSAPAKVYASDSEFASGVLISWERGAGAKSYRVLRREAPSGSLVILGTTADLFFHDESAAAGVTYYYSIQSIGKDKKSKESAQDAGTRAATPGPQSWTFMVYLDGDNNLEPNALDDFNEMALGLAQAAAAGNSDIDTQLNLIVLFDRWDDMTYTGWDTTRLYHITSSETVRLSGSGYFIGDLSGDVELDMADPDTLDDFVSFCIGQYPADHYALVLWNHGQGVRASGGTSSGATGKSVCQDDSSGDMLYVDEIQQALVPHFSSVKLDILAFDACLMGMAEVAYEFRGLADYMVASMAFVQVDGWDYENLFGGMTGAFDESAINPADMGYHMVDTYRQFITATYTDSGETLAAVKLSEMEDLKDSIDDLAVALYAHEPYVHTTINNSASTLETARDASVHFYDSDLYSLMYPYYNLYDLCARLAGGNYSSAITQAARDVISHLDASLVWTYGDSSTLYGSTAYAGAGATAHQGLSLYFSRGNRNYTGDSYYLYNAWYTIYDLWGLEGAYYGNIDFCTYDNDSVVETWLELHEAWYDPGDLTFSSY